MTLSKVNLILLSYLFLNIFMFWSFSDQKKEDNSARQSDGEQKIPTVEFCQMVSNPEAYDNKIVRVRASYASSLNGPLLYDLKCRGDDKDVWPSVNCDPGKSCPLEGKLSKSLEWHPSHGPRAELVITGKFLGPKKTPGRRYGPQGGLPLGFVIFSIEKVVRIPRNAPAP